MSDLTLEFARKHVEHYNRIENVIRESTEAMDCYDCEAFLQLGIDAFRWLIRADYVIRKATYLELYEHDPEIEEKLRQLCGAWLKPCEKAKEWAAIQHERGYEVSNLDEFERCCQEMNAIVECFAEEAVIPESLESLAEEAFQEHQDGQTAEFF